MKDVDLIVQTLKLIFLTSYELHCLCNILDQISPLIICIGGGEFSEQKICFKGDGDGRDGNGAKFVASLFNCWCYKPVTAVSLCLLDHAYHVEFQLVKESSSLYVTVVFLI